MSDVAVFGNTEIVDSADERIRNTVRGLAAGGQAVYSSITGTDFEARKLAAAGVMNAEPLGEHLGATIEVAHVVVQAVEINDTNQPVNPETGEVPQITAARVVFIQPDGKAYASLSTGILKATENLISTLGQPSTWPEPVKVKAVKAGKAPRQYYTLTLA